MQNLSRYQKNGRSAWSTVQNPAAISGQGGLDCVMPNIEPGEECAIAELTGCGTIHRLWMTWNYPDLNDFDNRERNQTVWIDIYWDGAEKPAVSAPIGDFFGHILGVDRPFQNALFEDSTGRAYICHIPMPFKKGFRMTVRNESSHNVHVYHELNMTVDEEWDDTQLYFHAQWRKESPCPLGKDFDVLPAVRGKGRYLGAHIGVVTDPYVNSRWADGQTKIYLDDEEHPSLYSGSVEDYYGSAWGWDVCFIYPYTGRLLRDVDIGEMGRHSFYRYHVDDPIYFSKCCQVSMSQRSALVVQEYKDTVHTDPEALKHIQPDLSPAEIDESEWGLIHFSRSDHWQACAFFYLDRAQL